jgi:hypothetical protein
MDFGCPPASCGSNSPDLNVFPYNGLHPDGCRNREGAALEKFSLHGKTRQCDPDDRSRLSLDAVATDHGYELVARDDHDAIKCKGTELVGVTFVMTSQGTSTTLRISQIATTDVTRPGWPRPAGPAEIRTVYLITPAEQPASSLCSSRPPGVGDGSTPMLDNVVSTSGKLSHIAAGELASYAIIIAGAVYSNRAEVIADSITPAKAGAASNGHRWFNIACADDALAQTELSGLAKDPIVDLATAKSRLPALHMFSAKYCDGISATSRGTPIAWAMNGLASSRPPDGGEIEAQWGPSGATCISHSRLWLPNKTISLPSQLVNLPSFTNPPLRYPMGEQEFLKRVCQLERPACDKPDPGSLTSYTRN